MVNWQGLIRKQGRGVWGQIRQRHVFLFSDLLIWTTAPNLKFRGQLELGQSRVQPGKAVWTAMTRVQISVLLNYPL